MASIHVEVEDVRLAVVVGRVEALALASSRPMLSLGQSEWGGP